MEQVVPSLGQAVDMALVDKLVVWGICATLVNAEEVFIRHIRFVWRLGEVLRGEGLSVGVLGVRRESGVQVCAQHMHEDGAV